MKIKNMLIWWLQVWRISLLHFLQFIVSIKEVFLWEITNRDFCGPYKCTMFRSTFEVFNSLNGSIVLAQRFIILYTYPYTRLKLSRALKNLSKTTFSRCELIYGHFDKPLPMNLTQPRLRNVASSVSWTSHLSPRWIDFDASSWAFSEACDDSEASSENRPSLFLCLNAMTLSAVDINFRSLNYQTLSTKFQPTSSFSVFFLRKFKFLN